MAKKAKRGRKPGVKVGPYKMNLTQMAEEIKALKGGLHSKEKCVKYVADETHKLTDRDVTSYYPNAIINLGLYPRACGPNFLTVFKGFKDARVAAKRAKNFTKDKGLKI